VTMTPYLTCDITPVCPPFPHFCEVTKRKEKKRKEK